jgi:hypothetical protein
MASEEGTFVSYLDIAEMFLNFMLETNLQKLAGVDLTHYIEKREGAGGGTRHFGDVGQVPNRRNFLPLPDWERHGSCEGDDLGIS